MCAEFVYAEHLEDGAFSVSLHELADALPHLRNVNNLEQSYLDLLPRSCVGKLSTLKI
jgi:hypothetical protein